MPNVEALGETYETFAGDKKERGIYYTPRSIVDVMVDLSLRSKIDTASYEELLQVRILDPACGAGAFLIACYRRLLERALVLQQSAGVRVLSPNVKREILQSCIFGIDRDADALAVAAKSLHVLAEELPQTRCLDGNLVLGNGLIDDPGVDELAFAPRARFGRVISEGGFDLCIANPPYVFGEWIPKAWKEYFSSTYRHLGRQTDYYAAFLERCVTRFLRPSGTYAVIVPDAFLAREQRAALRGFLLREAPPHCAIHAGPVFAQPGGRLTGVSCAILIGEKGGSPIDIDVVKIEQARAEPFNRVPLREVRADRWNRFLLSVAPHEWPVIRAMENTGCRLRDVLSCRIARGEEVGKIDLRTSASDSAPHAVIPGEAVMPFVVGKTRYYAASLSKPASTYESPRLLVRKTGTRCIAAIDDSDTATLQSVYVLKIDDPVVRRLAVAVLNSDILNWYLRKTVTGYKNLFPQLTQEEIASLPFPARVADPKALLERLAGAHAPDAAKSALEAFVCELYGVPGVPIAG